MAHQKGKMLRSTSCKAEGCEKPASRRGWCQAHYMRWYRRQQREPGTYSSGFEDGEAEGCQKMADVITQMLRDYQGSCWLEGDKVCLEIQGHRFKPASLS